MEPGKARTIYFILLGISLALLLLAIMIRQGIFVAVFGFAGMALFIIDILLMMIFWRCPRCHKILPTSGMLQIEVCPYCGKDIY